VLREHEDRKCICTQNTEEGRRIKAGQWWDEERKVDTREKR
jgi:hypothetical protein